MSPQGFAGNSYILNINGSAGAFIAVQAKSTVRELLIVESQITAGGAANTLQGVLDYRIPNDGTVNGFTTVFRAAQGDNADSPQVASIHLGSTVAQRMGQGEIIGQLGQPIIGNNPPGLTSATVMIQLRSGSAVATSVRITELN